MACGVWSRRRVRVPASGFIDTLQGPAKDDVMASFASGELAVLVAASTFGGLRDLAQIVEVHLASAGGGAEIAAVAMGRQEPEDIGVGLRAHDPDLRATSEILICFGISPSDFTPKPAISERSSAIARVMAYESDASNLVNGDVNNDVRVQEGALARRRRVSNVIWKKGELEKLPMKDASVDVAMLSHPGMVRPHNEDSVFADSALSAASATVPWLISVAP